MTVNELKTAIESANVELNNAKAAAANEADATKKSKLNKQVEQLAEQLATLQAQMPVSFDDIVSIMSNNPNNKVYDVTIASVSSEERRAENGNTYINLMIGLTTPILGYVKTDTGVKLNYIRTIQMPYWSVELAMRGSAFFGRFTSAIADAAECGFADQYLVGLQMRLLAEFVPAGVDAHNPFTRKINSYGIKDNDRYIYHVISVAQPTDAVLLDVYRQTMADIRQQMRDAIAAKKQAKAMAASVSLLATDVPAANAPF